MKNRVLIRRIIVIAIAVCVVLALVLPLFVKADIAIGGDMEYQEADYYVTTDGPLGAASLYYGPGREYGVVERIDNGEVLHIIETCYNFYDQNHWGQVESDDSTCWVPLSQTTTERTLILNFFVKIKRFLEAIVEFFQSLK